MPELWILGILFVYLWVSFIMWVIAKLNGE